MKRPIPGQLSAGSARTGLGVSLSSRILKSNCIELVRIPQHNGHIFPWVAYAASPVVRQGRPNSGKLMVVMDQLMAAIVDRKNAWYLNLLRLISVRMHCLPSILQTQDGELAPPSGPS